MSKPSKIDYVAVTVDVDGMECTIRLEEFADGGVAALANLEEGVAEAAKAALKMILEAWGSVPTEERDGNHDTERV